jgi:hypothetical protein
MSKDPLSRELQYLTWAVYFLTVVVLLHGLLSLARWLEL